MTHILIVEPGTLLSLPLAERRIVPDTAAIDGVLAGDTVLSIGQSVSLDA